MRTTAILALSLTLSACATGRPIEVTSISDDTQFATAQTVTVTLSNFKFDPTTVHLKAGQPYVLRLENHGSGGHDFTAPEFFESARILSADSAMVSEGEVDLQKGATAMIHLVPAAGTYDLACSHFGHAALGMTGKIVVD